MSVSLSAGIIMNRRSPDFIGARCVRVEGGKVAVVARRRRSTPTSSVDREEKVPGAREPNNVFCRHSGGLARRLLNKGGYITGARIEGCHGRVEAQRRLGGPGPAMPAVSLMAASLRAVGTAMVVGGGGVYLRAKGVLTPEVKSHPCTAHPQMHASLQPAL